ncbi:hypothetical protein [Rubinisphaera brasiliensis]|uniref:Lipoprotein n=1 Tax=Rubinisphaera brasiliensis (strain ATCC 49424 / DSM 5305 / JCM 21570 / IAM 15109 / NBRC 103401 / IFAM 1448) TaxID=756272 RepID=F0SGF7_RUBBR|nr:hypothetical protein [Rubinisphaera brasiliensis]ADY60556.1 hypothetical protein Plabr_2958 [Rubinisphaera brasiliensis DSM 5305]
MNATRLSFHSLRLIRIETVCFVLFIAGCMESLPDAPPAMDLEAEKQIVRKNVQAEIDYIQADSRLSEAEKQTKIEEIKRGSEGYLKNFAEAKKARDEHYGATP